MFPHEYDGVTYWIKEKDSSENEKYRKEVFKVKAEAEECVSKLKKENPNNSYEVEKTVMMF